MKLIIDRSKWLRGEIYTSCLLRSSDGKMCCLGMLAHQVSPEVDLAGLICPSAVPTQVQWPQGLLRVEHRKEDEQTFYFDSVQANALMRINDSETHTDSEREAELKKEFAKIDIEVEFIDGVGETQ